MKALPATSSGVYTSIFALALLVRRIDPLNAEADLLVPEASPNASQLHINAVANPVMGNDRANPHPRRLDTSPKH